MGVSRLSISAQSTASVVDQVAKAISDKGRFLIG